ncbi:efflux RND transporter periplasmic adaptor subunit [Pleomorphovibrio marinus]|uniref:efflux RND transporter periplasmic adaptor subunit n=1 Tax=Pleomorphovibrio marinus TaxID=2164132 RepID=UPI001300826E|nr:HlyD family efflux transporter periplasmic adaptor subunit [Pleomorphovibrio marinus]
MQKSTSYSPFVLWAIGVLFFFSCAEEQETYEVRLQDIQEGVYASGKLMPKGYRYLKASKSQQIWEVAVEEGDIVEAGDLILVLGAEGERRQREYLKEQIQRVSNQQDASGSRINELQAQLNQAEEQYALDTKDAEDLAALAKEGAVSVQRAREAALKASQSRSNVEGIKHRLENLREDLRDRELGLRQQLSGMTQTGDSDEIRSPFEGKVHAIPHKSAETVPALRELALIGHPTEFMLELLLDERDIGKVKLGQKVYFETETAKGEIFEAQLTKINAVMDEESRSFLAEAEVDGVGPFFPKGSVEANILVASAEGAMVIPRDYLMDGDTVLMVSNEKRKVKTGILSRNSIQVLEGLKEGDLLKLPEN